MEADTALTLWQFFVDDGVDSFDVGEILNFFAEFF
jgi:hypothetical protein